ncbi:MAG: creatininase family protein [Spirochaetales bacterium]|nr:creatininase family protein [Spirochaetales bacterium]
MENILLEEMNSTQLKAALRETDTVIIPAGSIEVLGPYGPLGTDYFVAKTLAKEIGRKTGCLVAPAIPYGDALELRFWPGTFSIDADVLKSFYLNICNSLIQFGFKRIFFFNAHMMNMYAIDYCGRILRKRGFLLARGDWWNEAFKAAEGIVGSKEYPKAHGGEIIASVIKSIRPDIADFSSAEYLKPKDSLAFHINYTPAKGGPFYTYPDFNDFCENGGWGNPSKASIEKGKLIIKKGVLNFVKFLKQFMELPYPEAGD